MCEHNNDNTLLLYHNVQINVALNDSDCIADIFIYQRKEGKGNVPIYGVWIQRQPLSDRLTQERIHHWGTYNGLHKSCSQSVTAGLRSQSKLCSQSVTAGLRHNLNYVASPSLLAYVTI